MVWIHVTAKAQFTNRLKIKKKNNRNRPVYALYLIARLALHNILKMYNTALLRSVARKVGYHISWSWTLFINVLCTYKRQISMLRFIALRGVRAHECVEHSQHRENVIYRDRTRIVELLLQLENKQIMQNKRM